MSPYNRWKRKHSIYSYESLLKSLNLLKKEKVNKEPKTSLPGTMQLLWFPELPWEYRF